MLCLFLCVGWGYGCTDNDCDSEQSRSRVFVTPVSDATIFVDYNNDGTPDENITVSQLQSIKIDNDDDLGSGTGTGTKDMSGALIFATDTDGNPVDIVVAWGQDPNRSASSDSLALDLGTNVKPVPGIDAAKNVEILENIAEDGTSALPGALLKYTIIVQNIGQTDFPNASFNVLDDFSPVFDFADYVRGSTTYTETNTSTTVNVTDDSEASTPFPLDEDGLDNPFPLSKRGGDHEITFLARVKNVSVLETNVIVNTGSLRPNPGSLVFPVRNFTVETPIVYTPNITIEKTVTDELGNCAGAGESVEGLPGTQVTYCFKVSVL